MKVFEEAMAVTPEGWRTPSLDTLEKALAYAMRTIANASNAVSGKATELLPLPEANAMSVSKCPIELPEDLVDKNYCEYQGFYHTDFTLPSEYFVPDVCRPHYIRARNLDFTYLFDVRLSNPDYINMGVGRQVRSDEIGPSQSGLSVIERALKRGRAAGRVVTNE
jgi:hypothetical protein